MNFYISPEQQLIDLYESFDGHLRDIYQDLSLTHPDLDTQLLRLFTTTYNDGYFEHNRGTPTQFTLTLYRPDRPAASCHIQADTDTFFKQKQITLSVHCKEGTTHIHLGSIAQPYWARFKYHIQSILLDYYDDTTPFDEMLWFANHHYRPNITPGPNPAEWAVVDDYLHVDIEGFIHRISKPNNTEHYTVTLYASVDPQKDITYQEKRTGVPFGKLEATIQSMDDIYRQIKTEEARLAEQLLDFINHLDHCQTISEFPLDNELYP